MGTVERSVYTINACSLKTATLIKYIYLLTLESFKYFIIHLDYASEILF